MKIVIDIPENIFKKLEHQQYYDVDVICNAILSGKPLPKHHGRLKDVDWIDENCKNYYSDTDGRWCYAWRDIDEAPTIIEADKENTDEEN